MSNHGEATAQGSVRFRRRLPGPIERVWDGSEVIVELRVPLEHRLGT